MGIFACEDEVMGAQSGTKLRVRMRSASHAIAEYCMSRSYSTASAIGVVLALVGATGEGKTRRVDPVPNMRTSSVFPYVDSRARIKCMQCEWVGRCATLAEIQDVRGTTKLGRGAASASACELCMTPRCIRERHSRRDALALRG